MKDCYKNSQESNYYQNKPKYGIDMCLYSATGILILLFLSLLLSCCNSVRYVTVPEYHYEVINKTDTFIQKDSIYHSDSVYIVKNGDTVTMYKTKYVYQDKWREKVVIDSIVKVDSIRVPYPVTVEKKLNLWQTIKIKVGGIALILIIILALVFVSYLLLKQGGFIRRN